MAWVVSFVLVVSMFVRRGTVGHQPSCPMLWRPHITTSNSSDLTNSISPVSTYFTPPMSVFYIDRAFISTRTSDNTLIFHCRCGMDFRTALSHRGTGAMKTASEYLWVNTFAFFTTLA